MSTPPPPSFGPPGQSGQPGGGGAPPWQPGGAAGPGGLAEGPAPSGKSKKGLVVAVVILVVAALVVLYFVVSSDDDGGGSGGTDAAAASAGLAAVVADEPDVAEQGFAELRRCPMGRMDDYVEQASERVELNEDLLDASDSAVVALVDDIPYVGCFQAAEDVDSDAEGVTQLTLVALLDPPADFEDFADSFNADTDDPTDFDSAGDHAGGVIYTGCADENCSAIWYRPDDELALALGLDGSDVEADDAVALLKSFIPQMTEELASNADDSSEEEDE